MKNPFDLETIGSGVNNLVQGVGNATRPIRNGIGGLLSSFGNKKASAQTQSIPQVPIAEGYQNHLQKINNAINGSFKKGGVVPKTGLYKVHKDEYVLTKEQNEKKGYETRYKTNPDKKKYSWDKSVGYRKKTGYFRTKIDGMGHTAGYKWAAEKEVSPQDRKRKYGANSPSFDEGVYEYKQRARQSALKSKSK